MEINEPPGGACNAGLLFITKNTAKRSDLLQTAQIKINFKSAPFLAKVVENSPFGHFKATPLKKWVFRFSTRHHSIASHADALAELLVLIHFPNQYSLLVNLTMVVYNFKVCCC